jgi:uncharacterized membrane protein
LLRQFAAACGGVRRCTWSTPHQTRAVGTAIGALSSHLGGYGIDDDFIKQVRAKVKEGTSGLFMLLVDFLKSVLSPKH